MERHGQRFHHERASPIHRGRDGRDLWTGNSQSSHNNRHDQPSTLHEATSPSLWVRPRSPLLPRDRCRPRSPGNTQPHIPTHGPTGTEFRDKTLEIFVLSSLLTERVGESRSRWKPRVAALPAASAAPFKMKTAQPQPRSTSDREHGVPSALGLSAPPGRSELPSPLPPPASLRRVCGPHQTPAPAPGATYTLQTLTRETFRPK